MQLESGVMQKDSNTGWIKLHRDIRKHWVYDKPEYLKAWIHLLIMANHKTKKWLVDENLVLIKRGQIITSMVQLGQEFKWSRNKVRHFLNLLENDTMINRNSNHNYTQLTICNYDTYQAQGTTEGTTEGTSKGQLKDNQRTQLKNVKNLKNVKELNMSGTVKPYPDRVDNYFNNIPDHLRKAFVEAYPNIDIDYQLKRAKTWLLANPNRAKRDFGKFCNNWLAKAMEMPSSQAKARPSERVHNYVCTDCNHKQQSPLPTWKVKCVKCKVNTLVLENELKFFR